MHLRYIYLPVGFLSPSVGKLGDILWFFEISFDIIAAMEKSVERGFADATTGVSSIAAGSILNFIFEEEYNLN